MNKIIDVREEQFHEIFIDLFELQNKHGTRNLICCMQAYLSGNYIDEGYSKEAFLKNMNHVYDASLKYPKIENNEQEM